MRQYIEILREAQAPLPRKFWLNPTSAALLPCGDHVLAVLNDWQAMGLPEAEIESWKTHLAQWQDDDYEDALSENQSDILELAMGAGWVRGGRDYPPVFLSHPDRRLVRAAARCLRDNYGADTINVEIGNGGPGGLLDRDDLDRFIRSGRLPR